jgi:hypothetical protein
MEYETRYLAPDEITLERKGDAIACALGDDTYENVSIRCAFPMSFQEQYIVLKDPEKGEIGVIRDMADLNDEQKALVTDELRRTYFVPVIESVHGVTEEFGVTMWDVQTDRGRCTIRTRHGRHSLTESSGGRILLTDVDSNRFEVKDIYALDARSRVLLSRLM